MRIVVCVKFVPDPADPVLLTTDLRLDRRSTAGMLSSLDEYAVEAAVRLRGKGDQVVALTMGPVQARSAVTRALQMGADEGVVVSDDALVGSDVVGTARVLAAAVRAIGDVDLVVTGMSSTDAGSGTVPVLVADLLGWGCAAYARSVELAGDRVVVRRDDPDGVRTLAAALPAVVSVTDRCGEPTYPSFKGILAAKRRPVRELDLAALAVDPGRSRMTVLAAEPAPPRPPGRIVADAGGSGAAALVEFLARSGVA